MGVPVSPEHRLGCPHSASSSAPVAPWMEEGAYCGSPQARLPHWETAIGSHVRNWGNVTEDSMSLARQVWVTDDHNVTRGNTSQLTAGRSTLTRLNHSAWHQDAANWQVLASLPLWARTAKPSGGQHGGSPSELICCTTSPTALVHSVQGSRFPRRHYANQGGRAMIRTVEAWVSPVLQWWGGGR